MIMLSIASLSQEIQFFMTILLIRDILYEILYSMIILSAHWKSQEIHTFIILVNVEKVHHPRQALLLFMTQVKILPQWADL